MNQSVIDFNESMIEYAVGNGFSCSCICTFAKQPSKQGFDTFLWNSHRFDMKRAQFRPHSRISTTKPNAIETIMKIEMLVVTEKCYGKRHNNRSVISNVSKQRLQTRFSDRIAKSNVLRVFCELNWLQHKTIVNGDELSNVSYYSSRFNLFHSLCSVLLCVRGAFFLCVEQTETL